VTAPVDHRPLPSPPSAAVHPRLLAFAAELERAGQAEAARGLRGLVASWWAEESAWLEQLVNALRIHHDINNALVGVRGNSQLLLMAPIAEQPGVRERLEVVLRESARIRDAAVRLNELKTAIGGPGPAARAA